MMFNPGIASALDDPLVQEKLEWFQDQKFGLLMHWGIYCEWGGPAGRLPISFPQAEGQLPLVYNHKPAGRGDDYIDLSGRPLFPFGHGLSYTTFAYSDFVSVSILSQVSARKSALLLDLKYWQWVMKSLSLWLKPGSFG